MVIYMAEWLYRGSEAKIGTKRDTSYTALTTTAPVALKKF